MKDKGVTAGPQAKDSWVNPWQLTGARCVSLLDSAFCGIALYCSFQLATEGVFAPRKSAIMAKQKQSKYNQDSFTSAKWPGTPALTVMITRCPLFYVFHIPDALLGRPYLGIFARTSECLLDRKRKASKVTQLAPELD